MQAALTTCPADAHETQVFDAVPVYQFDGTVSPDGGMAGTENPRERLASPLAD
ncbi:hypothetical protein [Catellatospora methionotrophica]|nr:hypothetical protein [Catellatospora methionotrophica]